jgi:serine/threonine-protein kinase
MSQKKGRVLCVDDEPHVLRALQWLLQTDFEIHSAASAQEALRLVSRHDFDVVVSDQRMPGVTGVEFLREVRKIAPRAMRILLTGYSDLDAMVRSVNESEVFRFITKPWDIRELPKLIGEAAEIARTAQAVPAEADAAADTAPGGQVTTVAMHAAEDILLVDDSPDVHAAVKQIIGDAARVQHAYNLVDAVRILKDQPIGVIVSEVKVGNIDATRLVRLMKSKYPEIVSVVFSGQKDAETVMTLINQGQVYRFIPKPFKPGYIQIVLNAALKHHRQLLENPAIRKRFAVEQTPQDAAESLLRDIRQAVTAAPAPAAAAPASAVQAVPAADDGLVSRLTSGLRRVFGP